MDEQLKQIADHYGEKTQLDQLIEESAELIVATRKFIRKPSIATISDVAEEIADVEIMIEQIKYLAGIRYDVEQYYKPAKIEQTLKRIEREGEANG